MQLEFRLPRHKRALSSLNWVDKNVEIERVLSRCSFLAQERLIANLHEPDLRGERAEIVSFEVHSQR